MHPASGHAIQNTQIYQMCMRPATNRINLHMADGQPDANFAEKSV
jgi:hypothetical protein